MLKKIIKNLASFLIIFIGLFFAGFISNLLSPHPELGKVQGITKTTNVSSPSPKSSTIITKPVFKLASFTSPSPSTLIRRKALLIPTPTPSNNQEMVLSTTPESSQSTKSNQVNVSLNGSSSFTVSVNDDANQCDVLSKALADGKISSLNMRYDSNFETYAVYQINGIGKENSVWWTYKVNGESPNQGCSFIKVKNEDRVEWKYIGS